MYNVNAYQIAGAISIRECRHTLPWEQLFSNSDELFYKIGEEKFLYIFRYGTVGFFNISLESKNGVLNELKQFCKGFKVDRFSKELSIVVQKDGPKLSFNKVVLPSFDIETIRLLVLNIAQVVALKNHDEVIQKKMVKIRSHNTYLEKYGKLNISDKKVKQHLGSVYAIKHWIKENSFVYNSLEGTWESNDLNSIKMELKKTFCLEERYRHTGHSLVILEENLQLFKDILDQKESSRLEWIIIILIAIEIIHLFIIRIF